ncbi:MAG: DUF3575 domain-containing protein [Flavobacteriales bacterium]
MKLSSPLIVFLLIFSATLSAQNNIVKWRPGSLAWNSIDFSYERVFTQQSTAAIKVGIFIPVDFTEELQDQKLTFREAGYSMGGYTILDSKLSGFSILPEYRYYTSASAPNGFYVSPYLKFWRAGIDLSAQNDTTLKITSFSGSLNILGAGAGIGYQWVIGDAFTIDWNMLGLGVDAYILHANLSGVNAVNTAASIQENFPGSIISTDGSSTSVTSPPMFNLGFKSNLSIGYKF